MSKFNGHHHSPGEVRNRKTTGHGSGRSPLVRSPADQIRHLCAQYERGLIELPELEEKLEIAVAQEASESTLAADLDRVASGRGAPLPPPSRRGRPFPTTNATRPVTRRR